MKFTKPFYGCRDGDIYPTQFAAGDECPPELLAAAKAVGSVSSPKRDGGKPTEDDMKAKDNGNSDS